MALKSFLFRCLEINVTHLLTHNIQSVIVLGNCLGFKKRDLLLGDVAHIAYSRCFDFLNLGRDIQIRGQYPSFSILGGTLKSCKQRYCHIISIVSEYLSRTVYVTDFQKIVALVSSLQFEWVHSII